MGSFENSIDISFLGTKNALAEPVVEQYSEYVGVFKGIGSSTPMIINNSSFFLTYLVDSKGNTYKIADDSDILGDVRANFLNYPTLISRLDQATELNENLAGEHKITSIGTPTPLLYSQIGSGRNDSVNQITLLPFGIEPENASGLASFITTLTKDTLETLSDLNSPNDFEFITNYSYNTPEPAANVTVDLGTPLTGTGSITLDSFPDPDSLSSLLFEAQLTLRSRGNVLNLNPGDAATFTLSIEHIRSDGQPVGLPSQQSKTLSRPDGSDEGRGGGGTDSGGENDWFETFFSFQWQALRSEFEDGDEIYLKLTRNEGNYFTPQIKDASFGIISQNPPAASPPNFDNQNPKGYWETGSNMVLTASAYLSEQYGNIQRPLTSSEDFGFPPIKNPFLIEKGDKIRFQFNESNTYTIYNTILPSSPESSGSRLYLILNTQVPSNLNSNNFVLYRIVNDGQFITIDAPKNQSETTEFTGLVLPKYLNPDFKENLNATIQQLKQDGVIEE